MTDHADHTAILDIAHRFDYTFDAGDFDAHTALFSDGFSFRSDFGDHDSIESYRGWVEGFHAQMEEQGGTRHFALNPVITLDGDSASMRSYLLIVSQGDGSTLGTAVCEDEFVKSGGTWRLRKRTLRADANVPMG